MEQVHVIRHKVLIEGQSQRRVAMEMGLSRNTVKKYLGVSEPQRVEVQPRAKPVLDLVKPRMDQLLEEWAGRTTAKQRLTASRLHQELVGEGYRVGVTLVRDYLREVRRRNAEVFIPLVHRPGDEAQVDFFEVTVDEAGTRRKAWQFLMRLMYSGRDFAWLYERCDQLSFLDGHVRAFEQFGGVPHRCIYDNLSSAVSKVTFPRRQLTQRFTALASHYLFEPCFARVGEGHDKGGVEGRGNGVRLRHLTPIPRGESLRALSEALLSRLEEESRRKVDAEGRSVLDRFGDELERMRPLPPTSFQVAKVVPVSVRSTSVVKVEGAWYSVPTHWARLEATAYVGVEEVRIVCRGEDVAHPRQRFGGRRIRYEHYLPELSRKPQAVRQVAPELVAELGEPYSRLWQLLEETYGPQDGARVLARVLGAVNQQGADVVGKALERALEAGSPASWALIPSPVRDVPERVAVPLALSGYRVEMARASDYDCQWRMKMCQGRREIVPAGRSEVVPLNAAV
ncbi:MAG: IS21 family transposase, partial [Chloroflexi bacterium]|nr:IS21 family transposase [Chloroflexota bacterium]